jgi:hypothetical protein
VGKVTGILLIIAVNAGCAWFLTWLNDGDGMDFIMLYLLLAIAGNTHRRMG